MSAAAEAQTHWAKMAPVDNAARAAKIAFDLAWKDPRSSGREQELSADMASVRRNVGLALSPPQGEPRYDEAREAWCDAETRWRGYATAGIPPRVIAPDPIAMQRQRQEVGKHLSALSSRGVFLEVTPEGNIRARPSVLLNEHDKRRLAESKALFIELLQQETHI